MKKRAKTLSASKNYKNTCEDIMGDANGQVSAGIESVEQLMEAVKTSLQSACAADETAGLIARADAEIQAVKDEPQMVKVKKSVPPADFAAVVVETDAGTPLEGETMKAVANDLQNYVQGARIGIMDKQVRFPWNKVFEETGEDINNPNMRNILTYCENQLKLWLANRPTGGGPQVELDQEFLNGLPKVLHEIFTKREQTVMVIDALAAYVQVKTDTEHDLDSIKMHIKALERISPETWSVSAGAAPKVARLQNEKKRPTGMKPFDKTRKSRAPSAHGVASGLRRFSKDTQSQMIRAGLDDTREVFEQWIGYCDGHGVDEPENSDMVAFAKERPSLAP